MCRQGYTKRGIIRSIDMKDYPELFRQIEQTRAKLADEIRSGKVVEVPATDPRYAIFVDSEDAPRMLERPWQIYKDRRTFYAVCDKQAGGHRRRSLMHRIILGLTDPKVLADHIDGCGINNTRSNLRVATNKQNCANRQKGSGCQSKFKGVSFKYPDGDRPWVAYIRVDKTRIALGYYAEEEEAARAYNEAAKEYFGEFAWLNPVAEKWLDNL
jgi:hypothetical protein